MDVYIDILFVENLVMNYLILLLTNKFLRGKFSKLRLMLGGTVGALYTVICVIYPGLKFYTASSKILVSFLIVAITFFPSKIIDFLKTLAAFYISTFIFAGAAFYFMYFNSKGNFIRNGIIYIPCNLKTTMLLVAVFVLWITLKIFWSIFQQKIMRESLLVPVTIAFENKVIDISALIDTGNYLYDPITNAPVVVVEFKAIKKILPNEIRKIFESSKKMDVMMAAESICSTSWMSRFRIIPFSSLGRENGILVGFKPDYVEIGEAGEKRGVKDVIIGVCDKTLCRDESYRALLSLELM